MRAVIVLLALGLAAVVALPTKQSVIVGGSLAVISQYPSVAALLYSTNGNNFNQACVGTIVTAKALLTAAHCVYGDAAFKWRTRVGSSWANSGGSVYIVNSIAVHPSFNIRTLDYDIAILRTVASIIYSNNVQPVSIAGANYNLPDNQVVWAAGWGTTAAAAAPTEQLRHIQAWSINQYTCSSRYAVFGANVTTNMFCFGWPNVGTRDQCQGDSAVPATPQRIVGGSVTTIGQYPTMAACLYSSNLVNYWQSCGGTILNNRSVLTAAHCTIGHAANRWRFRVGSTWANSGGVVHNVQSIINHPNYNRNTYDNDIAVLRSASTISHNNNVRPVSIAGANYNLADNQVVWAAGWGLTSEGGSPSEQLRHVQIFSINQAICRTRYSTLTDNMLCSGVLNVGGRDQCTQDSGGPLYHNGVQVGVCSFGTGCARPQFPGVNARVSRFSSWISSNA